MKPPSLMKPPWVWDGGQGTGAARATDLGGQKITGSQRRGQGTGDRGQGTGGSSGHQFWRSKNHKLATQGIGGRGQETRDSSGHRPRRSTKNYRLATQGTGVSLGH